MELTTLIKANELFEELKKWETIKDMLPNESLRFFISIEAHNDTSLFTNPLASVEKNDEKSIPVFKLFVESMIRRYVNEIAEM